jgi:hypothetical protein
MSRFVFEQGGTPIYLCQYKRRQFIESGEGTAPCADQILGSFTMGGVLFHDQRTRERDSIRRENTTSNILERFDNFLSANAYPVDLQ